MKPVGQQIAKVRVKRGLSLGAVERAVIAAEIRDENGEQITLTGAALSRIEAGKRMPGLRALLVLSRVLGAVFVVNEDGIAVHEKEGVTV